MKPLPLPVRLAAGVLALAVEQARDLPRLVVEFPVTAVSQALQASMRVQQKVTEVAIKGDRALGALRPVEEKPSWATFDDDEPRTNGVVTALRPQGRVAEPPTRPAGVRVTDPPTPGAVAPRVSKPVPVVREKPVPTAADKAAQKKTAEKAESAADAPSALPDYPELSIPQLRAKLRTLSLGDLRALLEWEQAHGARPPFVTMLSNRITTVSEA